MGREDISPDLGTIARPLPSGGPWIVMVKSRPGVYYDAGGDPVPDKLAEEAGFDVAAHRREREKYAALEKARSEIEDRFKDEIRKVEREHSKAEPPADDGPFVEKTSTSQEPRRARLKKGGPIRAMVYDRPTNSWSVVDETAGVTLVEGLEKGDAIEALLAE